MKLYWLRILQKFKVGLLIVTMEKTSVIACPLILETITTIKKYLGLIAIKKLFCCCPFFSQILKILILFVSIFVCCVRFCSKIIKHLTCV